MARINLLNSNQWAMNHPQKCTEAARKGAVRASGVSANASPGAVAVTPGTRAEPSLALPFLLQPTWGLRLDPVDHRVRCVLDKRISKPSESSHATIRWNGYPLFMIERSSEWRRM